MVGACEQEGLAKPGLSICPSRGGSAVLGQGCCCCRPAGRPPLGAAARPPQALLCRHGGVAGNLLVVEAQARAGGIISSRVEGGYAWEEGPNSFSPQDSVLRTAVDAGVVDELVLADPHAPRFVYADGRLQPAPTGPTLLTFSLMSLWGKLRTAAGLAGLRPAPPGAGGPWIGRMLGWGPRKARGGPTFLC